MKKIYFFLFSSLIISSLSAQNIPNGGFENWSGSAPTGWSGSTDITQATPGHSGTYAAKGEKTASTYPNLALTNAPISQAFDYLNFYYKFNSVSADYLLVSVQVKNGSNAVIGTGVGMIMASAANFEYQSVLINYSGSGAASVTVMITMNTNSGPVPHAGSYFIVDDMVLSTTTGITEALKPEFIVGPNPTTNFVNVQLDKAITAIASISNLLGQEVKCFQLSEQNTRLDVSDLPNGIYLVAIKQEGVVSTRKIQVAK